MREPTYKLHKPSGQGRTRWRGKDRYWGKYDLPESWERYKAWKAEVLKPSRKPVVKIAPGESIRITTLFRLYFAWAADYYGRNAEYKCIFYAGQPLLDLYGRTRADEFGPLALEEVRNAMVAKGLSRSYINHQIARLRRGFRWAVSKQLIPASVADALHSLPALRFGHTDAKEAPTVEPIHNGYVDAVLPYVSRQVGAMIQVQQIMGMRSSEVCAMRGCYVDTSQKEWAYTPPHKGSWRGKVLTYFIGPRAQKILKPFIKAGADVYWFSPKDSAEERYAVRRKSRKTPHTPTSQRVLASRKQQPKRSPGLKYTTRTYRNAIKYAFDKLEQKLQAADKSAKVVRWHPHQLRHTVGTEIRRGYGLEGSKVSLGHSHISATQHYAERDMGLARKIARERG